MSCAHSELIVYTPDTMLGTQNIKINKAELTHQWEKAIQVWIMIIQDEWL